MLMYSIVCKVFPRVWEDADGGSAKVWFQEKADIGKCLDLKDLEELTDEFVKDQLLR